MKECLSYIFRFYSWQYLSKSKDRSIVPKVHLMACEKTWTSHNFKRDKSSISLQCSGTSVKASSALRNQQAYYLVVVTSAYSHSVTGIPLFIKQRGPGEVCITVMILTKTCVFRKVWEKQNHIFKTKVKNRQRICKE